MFTSLRDPRLRAAVLCLIIGFGASACAATGVADPATGTPTAASSSTATGATLTSLVTQAFPVTVVHDKGTTTIAREPLRVVALDASLVGAVAGLGVDVVGFTLDAPTLPDYFQVPETAGGVGVGTLAEPNIEKIAALQPDLIVSSTVRHDALYPLLERIAPTVFTATTGPTWKDNIRLVGEALGRSAAAEAQIAEYEARAAQVGNQIRETAGDPTISLVRFVAPSKPARLYGNASFPGIVLADAGLRRPPVQDVDEFMVEISPEEITLAEADEIFYTDPALDSEPSDTSMAEFTGNDLWAGIAGRKTAVADERWYSSVSVQGAHLILDDLLAAFGIEATSGSS